MVEESGIAGMKEDLAQQVIEGGPVDDDLRAQQDNIFWLYLYSFRHLITKSKYATSPISPDDYCPDLFKMIDVYEDAIDRITTFYDPFEKWFHNDIIMNMIAFLMVFHNKKHPEFEAIVYDPRYIKSPAIYKIYLDFLSILTEEEHSALNVLHEITYQYGFYAWDLLSPEAYCRVSNFDTFLIECIQKNDKFVSPYIDGFLKKDTINTNDCIATECLVGKPSETKGKSKHSLLVYIDPSDKSLSFNKLKHSVNIGMTKASNGKNPGPIGNQSTAKTLFRINVKSKSFKKQYVFDTIEYAIHSYRFFFKENPFLFITTLPDNTFDNEGKVKLKTMNKNRNAEVKKTMACMKRSVGIRYEQREPSSRAIGLWLWDKVHFSDNPMTQAEAIEELLTKKLPASFDISIDRNRVNLDTVESALRKEYRLACRCIEKMEVLSLSKSLSK